MAVALSTSNDRSDGDLRAVRPRAFQAAAGADVKHLRLQLVDGELGARERIGPRFLGGSRRLGRRRAGGQRDGEGDGEDVANHPRSLPKRGRRGNLLAIHSVYRHS